jgi:hypothetical protein
MKSSPNQSGQRPGGRGPGLCGFTGRAVITGADPDPSCTPAGIPSSGSDGEWCWGGAKQPGRTPTLVVTLPGRLPLRFAARAWGGLLFHAPPRSSWVSRPQPGPYGEGKGFAWARNKNRGACGATTNSQGKTNSPGAKGPRAQEPRREPGGRRQQGRTP